MEVGELRSLASYGTLTTVSTPWCAAGAANVKARVLKDGHLFVVHVVDPQLEMAEEETPFPETDAVLCSVVTVSGQTSGNYYF